MDTLCWKNEIPKVAGRYFFSKKKEDIDIPKYCKLRTSESWGKEGHLKTIEITFIEDPLYMQHHANAYEKVSIITNDKNDSYCKLYTVNGNESISKFCLYDIMLYLDKYWFYGPIVIPKTI